MAISTDAGRIFATSLHGLFILPTSILFVIGLARARRHSDPARCGLAWLRAVFVFAVAGAILTVLSFALTLHLSSDTAPADPTSRTPSTIARLIRTYEAALYISTVGSFLGLVSDILLLLTLVELGRGFVLVRRPSGAARLVRPVALAAAGVLGVLALVVFGLAVRYNRGLLAQASGEVYPTSKVLRDTLAVARLSGAVDVLLWVGSLGVLGWVVGGVVRGVGAGVRRSVSLVLAASIITSLRALGLMVLAAMSGFSVRRITPEEVFIVRPVVDVVPLLIVLVLLFVVSIRKEGGLWSAAPAAGPAMGQTGWHDQSQEGGEYAPQAQGQASSPEVKWS
ncbi:hypothetical protein B0T18DRAFT_56390 [Schizothecium vesticola]|uniref:Uncharacterized protein n=1 Tax=Schizothecium vesticola TaxID=314040 RepID=A0AA40K9V4_9PEZI|nr:hypothetical protein B0T18DRAFT_56390 [Schizothecium vesticola]